MRDLGSVLGVRYPLVAEQAGGWVNFNGTGTVQIFSSFNVSSITDNAGNGDWTINWLVPFASTAYAVSMMGRYDATTAAGAVALKTGTIPAPESITVRGSEMNGDTTAVNLRHVCVVAYGQGSHAPIPGDEQLVSTWAQWDATGALQDSENVTSIADNGTGDWTINMFIPYASEAAYTIGGSTQGATVTAMCVKQSTAMAAGSINVKAGNSTGAAADANRMTAAMWGYY